jgi:hypothetical protein
MKRLRLLLLLLLLLSLSVSFVVAQVRRPEPVKGDAALEARLHKLSQELR